VIQEERSFLSAGGGYTRTLTNRFFGLGAETRESAETSYTEDAYQLSLGLQKSLPKAGDDLVLTAGLSLERHNLFRGRVSGEPSTDERFPRLFEEGDNHEALWLSTGIRYDTRDSQHNPYEGYAVGINVRGTPVQSHWDVGAVARLFATGVLEVPALFHDGGDEDEEHPPTDVVAAAAYVEDTMGNLPFWALPSLGGGNTLRGFIANRWTGESAWHAAVEYRFWVIPRGFAFTDTIRVERLGMAFFGESGSVDDHLGDLLRAKVRFSYGVGFRASFERTALLRADLGFSNEGLNVTANFGLSF
jgi:outer membrane protein assembly factor BamA